MKPFIRRHKSGVSHIVRANYNTNQFGQQKKAGWYEIAARVRIRDRNTCIWCKNPASEVHHIKPLSRGGLTSMSNLACICETCHNKRHGHMHAERGGKRKQVDPF